jgi:putative YhdH/YhfP family quinone oxidoreductase
MAGVENFPCVMVRRGDDGQVTCRVEQATVDDLPPGDVLIQVGCSSLNYKDALACQAHPGIVKTLPHVPGIDCSGRVVASTAIEYCPSDAVIITGYSQGESRWGGFSRYVRAPAEWLIRRPPCWSAGDAMTLGTAGFTAAQCALAIEKHGVRPGDGDIVVTGASGAVGSLAVALLARLGYRVSAVTGKPECGDMLMALGAHRILPREEVHDSSGKAMLSARWAAAVDTVGGGTLATLLASIQYRGCAAVCGMVGGAELSTTVYPFILRGVALYGIDSAKCPRAAREEIWRRLNHEWRLDNLAPLRREINLSGVPAAAEEMLAGKSVGRVLIRPVV